MKITLYPKYLIRSLFVHGRHDFFKAGYKLLYPEYSRHGMTPWQHYVMDGKRKGFGMGNDPTENVFFREGYELEYPDVKAAGVDPWQHYAEKGAEEGRDNGCHPADDLFFAEGYLEMYPDVANSGMDPWHHYVLCGKQQGLDNGLHPNDDLFFAAGYLVMYPDAAKSGMDPWHHYVLCGRKEGLDNGLHPDESHFYAAGYLAMYPDVARSGIDPWHHYAEHGRKAGRDNGLHPGESLFWGAGYLEMYPDAVKSGMDPWRHYVEYGKKEGRDNGRHPKENQFFAAGYLEMYPDVSKSGMDPWRHYVQHGRKEGRDNGRHPSAQMFFPEGYKYNYPSCVYEPYGNDLWRNYIKIGKAVQRNNGLKPLAPYFNGAYLERHPGGTEAQAWKDFILNFYISPQRNLNLYPAETGIREVLKRQNPCVAVIMPVYNRKNIVMNAITSVRNQTWAKWHLYVVDDFSDDGTFAYLKSAISDPRVILLKSETKGVCGARNTAIAHMANEEYVAYLDSDNTWNPEYLELMLCRMIETNTLCCYGIQKRQKRKADGSIQIVGFRDDVFDIYKLRKHNFIDLNVFMHSASVFKEIGVFDQSLRRVVDWDFILRCAERHSFSRLPYVSCNYDDTEDESRITQKNSFTFNYGNIVRNKHWIDWKFLSETADKNDESLVSVIIYFGKSDSLEFLKNCLNSLKNARLYGNSAYETEVILADDSCREEVHSAVRRFYEESLIDKYLTDDMVCHMPLSCNKALNVANGSYVVYLDSHSYVSVNWLDPLIDPLKHHHGLKGTTSKILLPDGAINSTGCLFDSVSGLPYDIFHAMPSDFDAAEQFTLIPSVNSYCCAFRTKDVAAVKGLYCIYESKLAIPDLCLQLGNGRPSFAYIPVSSVICPDDRHKVSAQFRDLEPFAERWFGESVYDEREFFTRKHLDGFVQGREIVCSLSFKKYSKTAVAKHSVDYSVPVYDFSKLGYGCEISVEQKSEIEKIKAKTSLVVIKTPSNDEPYDRKYHWGDYYFAKSLAKAFARLGFNTRVDNLESWYSHDDSCCINIVLRGKFKFDCRRCHNSFNIMWVISHPDLIDDSELNEFDAVCVASEILTEKYSSTESVHVPCLYLPQCTDTGIFSPVGKNAAYSSRSLFCGNSRGVMRECVRMCIDAGVDIDVIGNDWSRFIGHNLIRSQAVPNLLLPQFYSNAEAVLNDHWADMKQNGIVSNRIFDVLACGRGIVTDNIQNIPEELRFACFSYENSGISDAVSKCREFNQSTGAHGLRELICDKYSFYRRALQICGFITNSRSPRLGLAYADMFGFYPDCANASHPKLSVIVPVYNGEGYIRSCLDSVLHKQNIGNALEVICIDDGSTDKTSDILDEYRKADQRLHVVRFEEKQQAGAGAARNIGLKLARGEFIHFIDSDDQVPDNIYADWIDAQEQTGADFSCARFEKVDFTTGELLKTCGRSYDEKVKVLDISTDKAKLIYDFVAPWNKLYRTSFVIRNGIRFDETMVRNDRSFYISSVLKSNKVVYYGACVYKHIINRTGSLVFQSGHYFSNVVQVFRNVFQICKNSGCNGKAFSEVMDVQFNDLFFWYQKCVGTEYEKSAFEAVYDFMHKFCVENKILEKCAPHTVQIVHDFESRLDSSSQI